ncbi:MAG: peroxide stress protein YaaA [Pseudomonadota bacterium]|jgi:cytoplasmic iron level regulating protein YaaA (DUF328/UPF0246 family)
MIFVLSPAKSLDYDTPLSDAARARATEPLFTDQAAELIAQLAPLTPPQVASLMDLSDTLAALNVGRYAAWQPQATEANSRPAVLAFNGDVYDGLQARSLGAAQLDWAQQHLVILSGLYGALRPMDRLQPYRLEMGTRLANPRGKDLYAFWGTRLADHLNERLDAQRVPWLVNLASQEYFKSVPRRALRHPVIDCVFEDWKGAGWKIISFHAKRARGLMARWMIDQRPSSADDLRGFDRDGYAWDASVSTPERSVFRRRLPA